MTTVGWGTGPIGITPWGGGPLADFRLLSAQPVAENIVRLTFNEAPYSDGVGGLYDALDDTRYSVTLVPGGVGLDGNAVRVVAVIEARLVAGDALSLDVVVDRPFSPYPCQYSAACVGLRGVGSGLPLTVGYTSAVFSGLLRTVESQSRDLALKNRDMASPQTPAATMDPLPDPLAAVLGSFNTDATGDYAFDEGLTSYRKRGLRRTYCRKRKFVFLPPEWGVGVMDELKRTNNAERREAIRADIEEQWLQEPETAECSVTVMTYDNAPSVVGYYIKAKMRDGRSVAVTLPFNLG